MDAGDVGTALDSVGVPGAASFDVADLPASFSESVADPAVPFVAFAGAAAVLDAASLDAGAPLLASAGAAPPLGAASFGPDSFADAAAAFVVFAISGAALAAALFDRVEGAAGPLSEPVAVAPCVAFADSGSLVGAGDPLDGAAAPLLESSVEVGADAGGDGARIGSD